MLLGPIYFSQNWLEFNFFYFFFVHWKKACCWIFFCLIMSFFTERSEEFYVDTYRIELTKIKCNMYGKMTLWFWFKNWQESRLHKIKWSGNVVAFELLVWFDDSFVEQRDGFFFQLFCLIVVLVSFKDFKLRTILVDRTERDTNTDTYAKNTSDKHWPDFAVRTLFYSVLQICYDFRNSNWHL